MRFLRWGVRIGWLATGAAGVELADDVHGRLRLGGFAFCRCCLFPCFIDFHQHLSAGVIVGGAVVSALCFSDFFEPLAGGYVVRIDPECLFIFDFGLVKFAEVVGTFGDVEVAADRVDILGLLVGGGWDGEHASSYGGLEFWRFALAFRIC